MIQIDMFEVGLGAAMLLQFETPSGPVTVLADGGADRRPPDHVLKKLPDAAVSLRTDNKLHIDLMVGTHYDGDHLIGLPSIIRDPRITIGEAWLPPVANETDPTEDQSDEPNYLALQLAENRNGNVLIDYLRQKAEICERIFQLEREHRDGPWERSTDLTFDQTDDASAERAVISPAGRLRRGPALTFFKAHLTDSQAILGARDVKGSHADEMADWPDDIPILSRERLDRDRQDRRPTLSDFHLDDAGARSIALIRKGEAKKAITAIHLSAVVDALHKRKVAIRVATVNDGTPRRFVWRAASKRFVPTPRDPSDGPELTLLGPSDGLVRKHRDLLPVGSYVAMFKLSDIPLTSISPSNQLSYVMRFAYADQAILVTGDAGFVDFKPTGPRAPYYQPLLDCIRRLDVIQIAHHGGHNAHFYRCLLAAGFADEANDAYLLLSHAVDDPKRPSSAFGKFIEHARAGDRLKLLFTSRPLDKHVRDYKDLIQPSAGGLPSPKGDVRLSFDGSKWSVTKHCVEV